MAVAAYASLLSLTQVLNSVRNRAQLRNLHVDINQIETLHERVNYLVGFLEIHHQSEDGRLQGLWRKISELAFEAEEMFDLHVVNQLLERSKKGVKSDFFAFCEDLERLIQKIDHIKTELPVVEEIQTDVIRVGRQPKVPVAIGGKNVMVGFDEHMLHIMDELTKDKGNLKIIPITGMGGIGKTTLARNVFQNQCIVDHFDMKIWLTISQEYNVQEILTGLVNDGVVKRGSGDLESLGLNLYQKLFDRRYLIVMDDMWAIEAWYDFKRFFPDNGNGSRIMVTTRLENVAKSLGSFEPYSISFLEKEKEQQQNLFCQISFGEEGCPYPELEEIGKRIARGCRGFPLEITAIGGLLANSNMTKEFWESVAENVSSLANSGYDEHCLQILFLSYNNLPIHLKPCFLYLRSYPEDRHIFVDELIPRWVVEGFIKPTDGQSLEEIAMEYLKDLISRNLIFIHRWDWDIKSCGLHDLFRDLCSRELDKQCFIHLPIVQHASDVCDDCFQCGEPVSNEEAVKLQNFVILPEATHQGIAKTFKNYAKKSRSAARSVANRIFGFRSHGAVAKSVDAGNIASSSHVGPSICGACQRMYSNLKEPRLVRIITDRNFVHSTQSPYVMADLANEVKFIFPSLIHLLWNLQILGIHWASNHAVLPKGIWKLPEIRHIEIGKMFTGAAILPNPADRDSDVEGKDFFILKNLQTLSIIVNLKFTKNVLDRIPNLKTLSIRYQDKPKNSVKYFLGNISRIKTLKSLTLEEYVLESIDFPNSLKELVLNGCMFSWEDMSTIGLLPCLEVLSLRWSGVGRVWAPVEGQFLPLRVLEIITCDLVQWTANEIHFPKLEKLMLRGLKFLEEIPLGIGDINTLQTIELYQLSEDAINSAKKIWEEQQSMENDSLQFHVYKDYHGLEPIRDWNV